MLLCSCTADNSSEPYQLSLDDKARLRSGDIIMRRGRGVLSTFIVSQLGDTVNISHCGIIKREGEHLNVIHCLSRDVSDTDGVQTCSLDDFTDESVPGTIRVVRCKNDTTGILLQSAEYYLHTRKQFDTMFDINDSSKFFCSEMPVHILKNKLGINVVGDDKKVRFSSFFNPKYFNIVINHTK